MKGWQQETGEFAPVDADDFAIALSGLLDGLAVQVALEDPEVQPRRAFGLAMRFAAGQLQFWGKPAGKPTRKRGT
jgi:BetI-type transcriptional repressor, C-terminal